jgi:hypothetical protein
MGPGARARAALIDAVRRFQARPCNRSVLAATAPPERRLLSYCRMR